MYFCPVPSHPLIFRLTSLCSLHSLHLLSRLSPPFLFYLIFSIFSFSLFPFAQIHTCSVLCTVCAVLRYFPVLVILFPFSFPSFYFPLFEIYRRPLPPAPLNFSIHIFLSCSPCPFFSLFYFFSNIFAFSHVLSILPDCFFFFSISRFH